MRNTIFISFLFFIFACQNEVDKFVPEIFIPPGDFHDALEIIQNLDQVFEIDNRTGGILELGKSQLAFPPEVFIDESNQIVDGIIQVEIIEIANQRDIIKYNLATETHDGELLESIGMLNIQAKFDGKSLMLAPGKKFSIQLITDINQNAASYERTIQDDITQWSKLSQYIHNGDITIWHDGAWKDTTGYQLDWDQLGWVALLSEINISTLTSVCLELLDSNSPDNSLVYLMYDDLKACQRLTVSNTIDCGISMAPSGYTGKVVLLAHKGMVDNLEYMEAGVKEIGLGPGEIQIDMSPTFVAKDELLQFVENL